MAEPPRKTNPAAGSGRGAGGDRDAKPARARRENRSGRSDDELLRAWRAGDTTALAELLRGYQPRVYAVCYRMLQSSDEAMDLTQDALAKVLEGLHTYDGRSQLSTWVIRVAMNCCLSYLRKLRLRRHGSIDEPGAAKDRALAGEQVAEVRVERAERDAAVERAITRLEPEMRSIVVLRDVQGLEYQQIGEVLGVPVGTVKSRLFRARVALRDLVQQEWPDHPLAGQDRRQDASQQNREDPPTP